MISPPSQSSGNDHLAFLRARQRIAPSDPGVYLMKGINGKILYIGKAISLKKRLAAYFNRPVLPDPKTTVLVKKIVTFETIVTETEKEALILEANLIKRYRPRYNIDLKDGKRYPSLCLDTSHPYPNLTMVRKPNRRDVRYFGPYSSSRGVRETLRFVNKTFKLRKCKNREFATRNRPCLHYQMGNCLAPCCLDVDPAAYREIIRAVTLFLNGRTPKLIRQLKDQMHRAAEKEAFEAAALFRDQIFALERTIEKQVAVTTDFADRDVLGLATGAEITIITVMAVRGGFVIGTRHFPFDDTAVPDAELLESFVRQYYERSPFVPPEILVPHPLENESMLGDWLSGTAGRRVRIHFPQRGRKVSLKKMANQNAAIELKKRTSQQTADMALLMDLQKRLRLPRLPERIECFDNSNLSGTNPVAGMVVFVRARPYKRDYRKFRLNPATGSDDYMAMAEVLTRRFQSESSPRVLPDLLVVDGGKGQLNVALAVLKKLGLADRLNLLGLAKKDEARGETEDKIYLPGRANPVSTTRHPQVLRLLERIRDEAHRFAITFQ
ncbi:MAG: excinuclease ABC subunit C, partial [Deltaproteobacteria bacterium]